MLHISTQKLIEKLLERTDAGAIDWKEHTPQAVALETEGYVVELTGAPPSVRLAQESGRELEFVTEDALKDAIHHDGRNFAEIVSELTKEALRYARGTEKAIQSILGAMDAPKIEEADLSAPPTFSESDVTTEAPVEETDAPETEEASAETLDTEILEEADTPAPAETPDVPAPVEFEVELPDEAAPEATPEPVDVSSAVDRMVAEVNGVGTPAQIKQETAPVETVTTEPLAVVPPPPSFDDTASIETEALEIPAEADIPHVAPVAIDLPAAPIETVAPKSDALAASIAPVEPRVVAGFSFRNKVTAAGLALGGNSGTLIPGVPDDVRERADTRERAQAEAKLTETKHTLTAANETTGKETVEAPKSPWGYKAWT